MSLHRQDEVSTSVAYWGALEQDLPIRVRIALGRND